MSDEQKVDDIPGKCDRLIRNLKEYGESAEDLRRIRMEYAEGVLWHLKATGLLLLGVFVLAVVALVVTGAF